MIIKLSLYEIYKFASSKKNLYFFAILLILATIIFVYIISPWGSNYRIINKEDAEYTYENKLDVIINNAENNLKQYTSQGYNRNSYVVQVQQKTLSAYSKLYNLEFHNSRLSNLVESYLTDSSYIFFILLASGFLSSTIFFIDRECNIQPLLLLTKNGQQKNRLAKCVCCIILAGIYSLLQQLLQFIFVFCKGNLGLQQPIQLLDSFATCPYHLTIHEVIIIRWIQCVFFSIIFTMIFGFIAYFCSKQYESWVIVIIYISFNYFLLFQTSSANVIKNLNPFYVINTEWVLSELHIVHFMQCPIDYIPSILIVYIVLFLINITMISIIKRHPDTCTHQRKHGVHILKKIVNPINNHIQIKQKKHIEKVKRYMILKLNLEFYELYKFFTIRKTVIIVLLIVGKILLSYLHFYIEETLEYTEYKKYMSDYSGELTLQTQNEIKSMREDNDFVIQQYSEYENAYKNKTISKENYLQYLSKFHEKQSFEIVLSQLEKRVSHILELREQGINGYMVYEVGWEKLLLKPYDIVLLLTLILLFSDSFILEYTNMYPLLKCTLYGSDIFKKKINICIIISIILSILFYFIDITFALYFHGLPMAKASLASISSFNMNSQFTLGSTLIVSFICQIIGTIILGIILATLSVLANKQIIVISSITLISLIPHLLNNDWLSPNVLLTGSNIVFLSLSYPISVRLFYLLLYFISLILLTIAIYLLAFRKWRYGKCFRIFLQRSLKLLKMK